MTNDTKRIGVLALEKLGVPESLRVGRNGIGYHTLFLTGKNVEKAYWIETVEDLMELQKLKYIQILGKINSTFYPYPIYIIDMINGVDCIGINHSIYDKDVEVETFQEANRKDRAYSKRYQKNRIGI